MGNNKSGIRALVRQMLRDEFVSGEDFEWEDDEVNIHIDNVLRQVSKVSPYMAREVLVTIEDSRELDISHIEDLIYIDKVEYPIGNDPRSYRNFKEIDNETIEIDTTLIPDAGGSGVLTGTVTFTDGSTAITGVGTNFDGELKEDYFIKKSTGTRWYRVKSIESDTALTLAEVSHDSGADTAGVTKYCYEVAYVFCAKLHSLTESSSTLKPLEELLLVDGVCAYAAIAKAREHINKVNVGGAGVARDLLAWGQNKLAIFKTELRGKPRVYRDYPKS